MNVRFEEQNVRFKVSEDELKQLRQGDILSMKLDFLGHNMTAMINPCGTHQDMEVKQVFDGDTSYLTLLVSDRRLEDLHDMGKDRDGVDVKQGALCVSLQVDVRKDSRPREKK